MWLPSGVAVLLTMLLLTECSAMPVTALGLPTEHGVGALLAGPRPAVAVGRAPLGPAELEALRRVAQILAALGEQVIPAIAGALPMSAATTTGGGGFTSDE